MTPFHRRRDPLFRGSAIAEIRCYDYPGEKVPPITQRSGALWVWKQRIWGEKKGGLPFSLPSS